MSDMNGAMSGAMDLRMLRGEDTVVYAVKHTNVIITKEADIDGQKLTLQAPGMEIQFQRGNGTWSPPVIIPVEMALPLATITLNWVAGLGAAPPTPPLPPGP